MQAKDYHKSAPRDSHGIGKRPAVNCAGCDRPANFPDPLCQRCRAMPSFARWFDRARARP